jgi:two-component system sensor histidine kinase ArlS
MAVRLRITFLFTLLVFIILVLVCTSIYYFSFQSRITTVKTRLTNRAITIGRLLSRSDVFSNEIIQRFDSATSIAFVNKLIQAYDYKNNKIYAYSSLRGDSIRVDLPILAEARLNGSVYFTNGKKDIVAFHYVNDKARLVVVAAGEDEEGKRNLKQLKDILLLSFFAGLMIALCGGYFFSKGLLKPIKKIADDVNVISARNLSRRIDTGMIEDEWHYLSDTLNDLLNRLQESFEMQKRFIANASHELSTPLTSISSQVEVALQRDRAAEDYRGVLKSVHSDVLHMSKLTQTLLQFAKASGTAAGLEIELVRIDEILFRLPYEIAKVNSCYSMSFEFPDMPEEEDKLLVFGNEELLCTALKNIVVNGCKYSENHNVVVILNIQEDEVIVSVKDTGMGIPEKDIENIFQPFYRVSDNIEGFGLGLSLTYTIIKLHKGQINVISAVGEGSTFVVRIPSGRDA